MARLTRFFQDNPRAIAWDETRGLGCYRCGDGSLSLFAHYRCGTRQKKRVLGKVTELSLPEARRQATELLLNGRNGKDIISEAKAKAKANGGLTLGHAYAEYTSALKRKGCSPATLRLNDKNWRLYLSKYAGRELASFTKTEVRALHSSWRSQGPVAANAAGRLLRTIFNYSIAKLTDEPLTNPCVGIEWFPQKNVRKTIDDLPPFMAAVARLDNPIRVGFWCIAILTGLRKNDISTIRWEDVKEDRVHIPHPKMGRPFDCPMTPSLKDALERLKAHGVVMFPNSPWVCAAASKSGHLENPHDATLGGVTPHCARRHYASVAAKVLKNPYLVAALLNHKVGGVTAGYVQVDFEQRREAATQVADFLKGCANG
jgi:integrase